jgi:hypothetical protein
VSYSDQLLLGVSAIIILETSTSSLSQVLGASQLT